MDNKKTGTLAIKLGGIALGVVVLGIIFRVAFMCIVPAGYVAVQYTPNGGVKDNVLTQGWHVKSPLNKTTLYTVGIEQSYLTSGSKGDSKSDESFSASSKEGKAMQIDLTFTYQYDGSTVADVFRKFKGQSGIEIRDSFIKPNIVSWSKEVLARYKVSDALGENRATINQAMTTYLSKKFDMYNIKISNVSLINIEVDEETQKAINAKITAQQNAETQEINNKTNIAKAEAEAKVKTTQAQAEADAQKIKAEAEAEANRKIANSVTDRLIKYTEAQARKEHGWVTVKGGETVTVTNPDETQKKTE